MVDSKRPKSPRQVPLPRSPLLPSSLPRPHSNSNSYDGPFYPSSPRSYSSFTLLTLPQYLLHRLLNLTPTFRFLFLTLLFLLYYTRLIPLPFQEPTSIPHPIPQLTSRAHDHYSKLVESQPRNLKEAVEQYRSREGRNPPKGFDEWYNFVQRELSESCPTRLAPFSQLSKDLRVFWGIQGRELRDRIERLGEAPVGAMGRVRVRNGRVVGWAEMREEGIRRGGEEMEGNDARVALVEMFEELRNKGAKLPDVDFWVNALDEPRTIADYQVRKDLEARAKRGKPRPYSSPPTYTEIDINHPHSPSSYSLLLSACPPNSLARQSHLLSNSSLPPPPITSQYTSPFTTPYGSFLSSPTLERSSWCSQPDLRHLHQTLIRPLNFAVNTGENGPWPVLSNSKIEGFGDVLIPSWFEWRGKIGYDEQEDLDWKVKKDNLFWRGSNTGGRSEGLNWMGWLRSRIVSKTNRLVEWGHFDTLLLSSTHSNLTSSINLPSTALNAALTDIAFSSPDRHGTSESLKSQQTEPSFRFTGLVPFSHNYQSKAILDLDGTAYSARWLTLLKSKSALFKSGLYIDVWMDLAGGPIPWLHHVPLSIRFFELYNLLGYYFGLRNLPAVAKGQGFELSEKVVERLKRGGGMQSHQEELYEIAMRGREWALGCAGKKEMTLAYVWMLALEWHRLCQDERGDWDFRLEKGQGY